MPFIIFLIFSLFSVHQTFGQTPEPAFHNDDYLGLWMPTRDSGCAGQSPEERLRALDAHRSLLTFEFFGNTVVETDRGDDNCTISRQYRVADRGENGLTIQQDYAMASANCRNRADIRELLMARRQRYISTFIVNTHPVPFQDERDVYAPATYKELIFTIPAPLAQSYGCSGDSAYQFVLQRFRGPPIPSLAAEAILQSYVARTNTIAANDRALGPERNLDFRFNGGDTLLMIAARV